MTVSANKGVHFGLGIFLSGFALAACADEPGLNQVSFSREVAPILAQKCLACHGPEKPKGNYRLDTFSRALQPGHSGEKPVVPGHPEQSLLFLLLTAEDEDDRMPQKDDPLSEAEIRIVRLWIEQGALWDGPDQAVSLRELVPGEAHPQPPAEYPRPLPVRALAFHPNGKELAAGGYHEITVWDPEKSTLLRRVTQITQRTSALAYSPGGEWLAVAGGIPGREGELVLLDLSNESSRRVLARAADLFLSVAFSPDGARVAVAGADRSISIFDTAGGARQLFIQQHADWVTGIAFSPDGALLASASRDRSARVYDSRTGELQTTYQGQNGPVWTLAFSSGGQLVCTAGRDGKIHLWNARDGKKAGELAGSSAELFQLISEGDHLFSVSADKRLRRYSVKEKKLVRAFDPHGDWVYALALHPEKKLLASGSHDGEVRVWTFEGVTVARFFAAPGFSPQN